MNPEAMKPHGLALLDYHHGDQSATVSVLRDDGFISEIPAALFFRGAQDIGLELEAMGHCQGYTLDVGAGTGIHTLYLQQLGFKVCAIEISPEAVLIMKERGVIDARPIDIMSLENGEFDTVLMMGHGIGMVETIAGLSSFLNHAMTLLRPGGQVLLTSLDVRKASDPINLEYRRRIVEAGRYFGEIRMRFAYGGTAGPQFGWLHVDPETLAQYAYETGLDCVVLQQEEAGDYLARLTKPAVG